MNKMHCDLCDEVLSWDETKPYSEMYLIIDDSGGAKELIYRYYQICYKCSKKSSVIWLWTHGMNNHKKKVEKKHGVHYGSNN